MAETRQGQRRLVLVLLATLVMASGGYGVWHYRADGIAKAADAPQSSQAAAKVPVTIATVHQADFPLYLYGLGTVTPLNSVTVASRVTGVITNVAVRQGQIVKQGDLLAEIDPRPYQAILDQATAKRAQDEANLKNAELNLKRYQTLLQKSYETQQNVDTQQALVDSTKAQISGDVASVEAAQLNLQFTRITSPLTGRTSFRTIDPGNIVQANQSPGLFTIVQLQPIYVTFTEPQDNVLTINKVFAEGPVSVDALSSDGKTILARGKLDVIDNRVASTSGTISLKAVFTNEDNALWPGLSVNTRTRVGTLPQAVLIPDNAVQHGPDGLFAYVVGDDGKVHRQTIKAGPSDGGNTVITAGLTPDQHVVISGQYRLVDGTSVDATPAAPTAALQSPPGEDSPEDTGQ